MDKPNLNKPVFKLFPKLGILVQQGFCPMCQAAIDESEFKDELSRKEFSISGLCQACQDRVFRK